MGAGPGRAEPDQPSLGGLLPAHVPSCAPGDSFVRLPRANARPVLQYMVITHNRPQIHPVFCALHSAYQGLVCVCRMQVSTIFTGWLAFSAAFGDRHIASQGQTADSEHQITHQLMSLGAL